MIKGETKGGFKYELDEEYLDNMELVDALAEVDDGNVLAISKVTTLLLGKEQKQKLYDFLRKDNGAVGMKDVSNAVTEILTANQDTKN